MKDQTNFQKTAIRFGTYLGLILIVIFLAMEVFVFSKTLFIRILDVVVIYFMVGRSLNYYQHHATEGHSYLKNMGLGVATSFFGMLMFSLFIFFYLSFIDQGYMDFLKEALPMGPHLDPIIIGAFLLVEGLAIRALSGYIQALMIKEMKL